MYCLLCNTLNGVWSSIPKSTTLYQSLYIVLLPQQFLITKRSKTQWLTKAIKFFLIYRSLGLFQASGHPGLSQDWMGLLQTTVCRGYSAVLILLGSVIPWGRLSRDELLEGQSKPNPNSIHTFNAPALTTSTHIASTKTSHMTKFKVREVYFRRKYVNYFCNIIKSNIHMNNFFSKTYSCTQDSQYIVHSTFTAHKINTNYE